VICLQGGAEFGAVGAEMDADLVRMSATSGRPGPIVVMALAGAPGREYDTANANGVRHFSALVAQVHSNGTSGPAPNVIAAPDARGEPEAAIALVASARLLVLPGGSPSRLLDALTSTGLVDTITTLLADGGIVMGASAGAMVLCERTWLPDTGRISAGLGLVPGALVLPHWTEDALSRVGGLGGPGGGITVIGLPEQSGVLVRADGTATTLTAVGHRSSAVVPPGGPARMLPIGESTVLPGRMNA